MEDGKANDATNEFEVVEMFGVDARMWIDLKGVIIVGGVFKQAVEGIEHFMGKQEKEFAKPWSAVLVCRRDKLTEKGRHNLDHLLHQT
jgi:hypothetical protein